jgi:hypothetical protein
VRHEQMRSPTTARTNVRRPERNAKRRLSGPVERMAPCSVERIKLHLVVSGPVLFTTPGGFAAITVVLVCRCLHGICAYLAD